MSGRAGTVSVNSGLIAAARLLAAVSAGVSLYNYCVLRAIHRKYGKPADTSRQKKPAGYYGKGSGGEAVLLLHGFMGSPSDFGRLPELLHAAGFTVHAPFLPGHGTRPEDLSKVTAKEWLDFTEAAYDSLAKESRKVSVIGLSLGGALAAISAAGRKSYRTVLLAPYFKILFPSYYLFPLTFYHFILSPFVPYVYQPRHSRKTLYKQTAVPETHSYNFIPTRVVQELFTVGDRVRKIAPRIRSPLLVIHSRKDRVADFKAVKKTLRMLGRPQVTFIPLEASNHLILWDFEAEEVERAVLEFLGCKPIP